MGDLRRVFPADRVPGGAAAGPACIEEERVLPREYPLLVSYCPLPLIGAEG